MKPHCERILDAASADVSSQELQMSLTWFLDVPQVHSQCSLVAGFKCKNAHTSSCHRSSMLQWSQFVFSLHLLCESMTFAASIDSFNMLQDGSRCWFLIIKSSDVTSIVSGSGESSARILGVPGSALGIRLVSLALDQMGVRWVSDGLL